MAPLRMAPVNRGTITLTLKAMWHEVMIQCKELGEKSLKDTALAERAFPMSPGGEMCGAERASRAGHA
jgi:hypothetical protein